jgi:hypothetical protein
MNSPLGSLGLSYLPTNIMLQERRLYVKTFHQGLDSFDKVCYSASSNGRRYPVKGAEGENGTEPRLLALKLSGKRTTVSWTSGETDIEVTEGAARK